MLVGPYFPPGTEPPRVIEWNGEPFYFYRRDYYRNPRGQLLHRVIYRYHHGDIPKGSVVHHRDENKLNNRIDNLVLMPKGDHVRLHNAAGRPGFMSWDTDRRSATAAADWESREPVDRVCELCGATYRTRSTYSRWCGEKCLVAARYRGLTKRAPRSDRRGPQPSS